MNIYIATRQDCLNMKVQSDTTISIKIEKWLEN